MTYMEFETLFASVSRKNEARIMLAMLLDGFDTDNCTVALDDIVDKSNLQKSNLSNAAKSLKDLGLIEIFYKNTKSDSDELSAERNANWSKPYYKLTNAVLSLNKRI